jgi:hypothetical protein
MSPFFNGSAALTTQWGRRHNAGHNIEGESIHVISPAADHSHFILTNSEAHLNFSGGGVHREHIFVQHQSPAVFVPNRIHFNVLNIISLAT